MDNILRGGFGMPVAAAGQGQLEAEALRSEDLVVAAKYLVPTDAYLMQGCLVAGGVPAVVADANHVQADLLMSPALGGVRVLVPASYLKQAEDILAAFERGEFDLKEDFDVGG
jgi:hypothetical protein